MEGEPGQAHPALSNAVVLSSIFEQLSIVSGPSFREEARNFRLVCKSWMGAVSHRFKEIQPLIVFDECSAHSSSGKTVKDFMKLMRTSSCIPYGRYKFTPIFFYGHEAYSLFRDFLVLCGPSMVHLQLEMSMEQLRLIKVRGLDGLKLDQLRSLSLKTVVHEHPNVLAAGIVFPIGILLGAAQQLVSFRLDYGRGNGAVRQRPIVEDQLLRTICRQLPASVHELGLSGVLLDRKGARMLGGTAGRGLRSLAFSFQPTVEIGAEVQAFLDSQADTLRLLAVRGRFSREVMSTDYQLIIPPMPQVVKLQVYGHSVRPFSIPSSLPRLEQLDADEWGAERGLYHTLRNGVANVATLYLRVCSAQSYQLVEPIAQQFTSLSELHLFNHSTLTDMKELLKGVFARLRSIQRLYIYLDGGHSGRTFSLDSLFTGLDEERCRELQLATNLDEWTGAVGRYSLLNLKGLKKLDCMGGYRSVRYSLTDVAGELIFLQMDHLEELTLPTASFSLRTYRRLSDRLKKLTCYRGEASLLIGPDYPLVRDDEL